MYRHGKDEHISETLKLADTSKCTFLTQHTLKYKYI